MHPASGELVAATRCSRLWRSSDDGATWTAVSEPAIGCPTTTAIAFDPAAPRSIWIARVGGALHAETGLLRSDDGGATWRLLANGSFSEIVATSPSSRIYLPGGYARYTLDGGATWTVWRNTADFAVDARDSERVYAAIPGAYLNGARTDSPVLVSDDGGRTWATAIEGRPAEATTSIAVDPADPRVLFAGATTGAWRVRVP